MDMAICLFTYQKFNSRVVFCFQLWLWLVYSALEQLTVVQGERRGF
jgi:hypothetical protein